MPERESKYCWCIRYHLDSIVSDGHELITKLFKDSSDKWFYGVHKTERPHVHWYLETSKKDQAIRSAIARLRARPSEKGKQDRWYSVAALRDSLTAYGSYVLLKPETSESEMYNISEEEVDAITTYAKQFENKPTESKKSKSVFALLQEYCKYDVNASIRVNFNKMYDWIVDEGLYNMYTETKMTVLFGMWKARADKQFRQMQYESARGKMFKNICLRFCEDSKEFQNIFSEDL